MYYSRSYINVLFNIRRKYFGGRKISQQHKNIYFPMHKLTLFTNIIACWSVNIRTVHSTQICTRVLDHV